MLDKKEYDKQYCMKNKERISKDKKIYYIKNRERILKNNKIYSDGHRRQRNKRALEYNRKYYQESKDIISKRRKEHYQNNREDMLKKAKGYNLNNKEKILKYHRGKYKTNLNYNLNLKIRSEIRRSLKGNKNGRKWESLVDYTLNDLIKRLKQTMPEGYTWQDYIDGKLHIDHKIPISAFNFTQPEHIDFKRCWALSNLRLLLAKENLIKKDKLYKPFQPTLKLC